MLITEILARNARVYGPETALVERDPEKKQRRIISWQDFDGTANQGARLLQRKGVVKGDRVVILMMNCLEWLPVYFAILRTGAWAVPLNFRFDAKTIARCIETAGARTVIFGPEFISRIQAEKTALDETVETYFFCGASAQCPIWAEDYQRLIEKEVPTDPAVPISLLDEAALYFTSGTTGSPKAVLLSHRNLKAACVAENCHHSQSHADCFLLIPPLYHTGAKMHWFGHFIVGAPAVILKGVEPRWIMEAISEENVNVVWLLVPWALDILLAIESGEISLQNYRLDQWRLMHIGAQPVPPSLIREWKRIFPTHQYDTNYGLTEACGPGCVHLGVDNMDKVGAIGVPGFDWEVMIVDAEYNAIKNGEPGELLVRGPGVMMAYYGNPAASSEVLRDGWLCTGDVARQDEEGFIWLVDRKKDVIITGGENIFPVEIEEVLQSHPAIKDAAVIGLPSLRLGEIAAAIVELKKGQALTHRELAEFCETLPRYKRPRRFIFDQVPRNPTGKIEKPQLREKYAGKKESVLI